MDDKLKAKLKEAMNSGVEAVDDMKLIIKNITKEIAVKSKDEGEDLHKTAQELYDEIVVNLKSLGKNSVEFMQACFSGLTEGMKESVKGERNLPLSIGNSLGNALKQLGEAGVYVSKESWNSIKSLVKNSSKKNDNTDEHDDENI